MPAKCRPGYTPILAWKVRQWKFYTRFGLPTEEFNPRGRSASQSGRPRGGNNLTPILAWEVRERRWWHSLLKTCQTSYLKGKVGLIIPLPSVGRQSWKKLPNHRFFGLNPQISSSIGQKNLPMGQFTLWSLENVTPAGKVFSCRSHPPVGG